MSKSGTAPVVLLGYRRPKLTSQVFAAIRKAKPSTLILVMDGPNPHDPEDAQRVSETRAEVDVVDWDCEVHRFYSPTNLGLKNRVSTGLDQAFSLVDRAIILEDDCLPSPDFFRFATELLDRYSDDDRIGIISGSQRLRGQRLSQYSYEFSSDVRIWGWATWARTWQDFSSSGNLDANFTSGEIGAIAENFAGRARRSSMKKMMKVASRLDSWALPFVVHCISRGYINAVAGANLIRNVGFGDLSTHTTFESFVVQVPWEAIDFPLEHPTLVVANRRFDELESRADSLERIIYPLLHPLDVASRLFRYLRSAS